jgi:hypothetical protein
MLKFDQALNTEKTKQLAGFSIEGSRLDKEGNFIKKCIARKAAFSLFPCNKACIAEILEPSVTDATKMISLADLKAAFKKAEEMETDLKKEEDLKPKYHSPLAFKLKSKAPKLKPSVGPTAGEQKEGTSVKPKNVLPTTTTPLNQKLKVGDRISSPRPKARTGRQIYNDPETWKAEVDCMSNSRKAILNKVKKGNTTDRVKDQMMLSEDMEKSRSDEGKSDKQKGLDRAKRNIRSLKEGGRKSGTSKTNKKGDDIRSGMSGIKGDKVTGKPREQKGVHLRSGTYEPFSDGPEEFGRKTYERKGIKPNLPKSEDMDKSNSTANIKTQMMQSEKTMKRKEILKSISQEAFDLFPHKEELLSSIRKTMPEASENEVMAFAKTFAYVALKKQEIAFAEMADESSFNEDE